MMISVGILEDDEEIRTGLRSYLGRQPGFLCDLAAGSVEELLATAAGTGFPDVLLADLGLPGMSGIDGMRLMKESHPETDIIVLTIYDDRQKVFDSLRAGASGYLLKNTPLAGIREAVEIVHGGGSVMSPGIARKVMEYFAGVAERQPGKSPLTPREKEIVVGLVDGLSYKLLADRMSLSIDTIRFHIRNIYKKLHVNSKGEVITKSLRGEL